MAPIHVRISEVFASLEPQKVAQASCLFGADRLEACPTLQPAPRFMAPTHVRILEVFPSHETGRLRVGDPRSGPRLCEAQRFMVPMRDSRTVEAFHEPGGARLRRALTDSCGWEIRARRSLAPPFMVQMRPWKLSMNRAGCGSQTRGPDRASVRRSGSWCQCAVATVEAFHEPSPRSPP